MCAKTSINSIRFSEKRRFEEKNITQVIIQNYSKNEISIKQKDVTRLIPAAQLAVGIDIPSFPFIIHDNGNCFDIDLVVDFPNGPGDVIIDYNKVAEPTKC